MDEIGKTNNNQSWLITDEKRLGRVEKIVRASILTPIFVLGIVGLTLGKNGFSPQFLAITKRAWLIRSGINSLLVIPTLALFYNGKGVSSKSLAQSGENITKLALQSLGVLLFVSALTSRNLGRATIPLGVMTLVARGYLVTSTLTRNVRDKAQTPNTIKTALNWGWFAGAVAESRIPTIRRIIGEGVEAFGLADHGFGVLHTGFGAASALAGLAI